MIRSIVFLAILFSTRTFAQTTMVDSTHGFSRLVAAFYEAKFNGDLQTFRKLGHAHYTNSGIPIRTKQDSLLIAHGFSLRSFPKMRVSDTVVFNGNYYCKVEYTLNCTRKVSENQIADSQMLEQMYNAMLGTNAVYFDKQTSSVRYYPKKSGLLVKGQGRDWSVLEFERVDVASYFSIEPRESFYSVEGLGGCTLPNYGKEQLGQHVYNALIEGRPSSIYCETAIQHDELLWAMKNEGREADENSLYRSLVRKKATIDRDAADLYKEFNWKETAFSQVYAVTETINSMSFSAILVEFKYLGAYQYFEIEAVQTPNGWRIINDINIGSFQKKNKDFIANRR